MKKNVISNWNKFNFFLWKYLFLGFGWEYGADPIQDDPRLFGYNIENQCDDYASQVRARSLSFKTNEILIPFGCDFQFENAIMEFKVIFFSQSCGFIFRTWIKLLNLLMLILKCII